jgi:acyl dehydratase
VGREIALTELLTVAQDRIDRFAEATQDRHWIHIDRERAQRESPNGTTIAHGFLTLSLLSYFMKQAIQFRGGVRVGINYGLNRVRFPSPVRPDSQIRARVRLLSLKEIPDAVEDAFSITGEGQGTEKPCCVAERIVRYDLQLLRLRSLQAHRDAGHNTSHPQIDSPSMARREAHKRILTTSGIEAKRGSLVSPSR